MDHLLMPAQSASFISMFDFPEVYLIGQITSGQSTSVGRKIDGQNLVAVVQRAQGFATERK
jgi:hypothetical protein